MCLNCPIFPNFSGKVFQWSTRKRKAALLLRYEWNAIFPFTYCHAQVQVLSPKSKSKVLNLRPKVQRKGTATGIDTIILTKRRKNWLLILTDLQGLTLSTPSLLSIYNLQAKNCIKVFCAHLFSHVGLTALVVIYSIFGAFIFSHLEVLTEER